jgi:hypothetical protein
MSDINVFLIQCGKGSSARSTRAIELFHGSRVDAVGYILQIGLLSTVMCMRARRYPMHGRYCAPDIPLT